MAFLVPKQNTRANVVCVRIKINSLINRKQAMRQPNMLKSLIRKRPRLLIWRKRQMPHYGISGSKAERANVSCVKRKRNSLVIRRQLIRRPNMLKNLIRKCSRFQIWRKRQMLHYGVYGSKAEHTRKCFLRQKRKKFSDHPQTINPSIKHVKKSEQKMSTIADLAQKTNAEL